MSTRPSGIVCEGKGEPVLQLWRHVKQGEVEVQMATSEVVVPTPLEREL